MKTTNIKATAVAASPTLLPRVTIFTANTGGGHRAAAQSLGEALDGRAQVSYLSLIDDHLGFPMNTWSATYAPWVNYTPWLYRLIYRYGASRERITATERAVYPLYKRKITQVLMAEGADLFVSVHPLHTDVLLWSLAEAGTPTPFVTVVTDPVTPPVAWFSPHADLCIVATPLAQATALACGLSPGKVRVIGLPIRRAFKEARGRPKSAVRSALGLAPDQPLVLLSGGGAGIGKLSETAVAIARRVKGRSPEPQLAIIAGRNREMYQRLRRHHWPISVQILGFVDNMADWLAASDLLVTKAGPGTLAEAACLGVPSIITEFIPGQEIGNVEWVTHHGAGVFEREPRAIGKLIADLLDPQNGELELMSQRAYALGRPDAADQIAREALALLD